MRRIIVATLLPAAVAAALAGSAAPAAASPLRYPGTVAATSTASWGTDGTVYSMVSIGNTLVLGGDFHNLVDPRTSQQVPASNLAALDRRTGTPVPGWSAGTDGVVYALAAAPDGSAFYAGGDFLTADGAAHQRVAAFVPDSGAVTGWAAGAGQSVRALVATNGRVYLGGDFRTVDGAPAEHVAAVDPVAGDPVVGWTGATDDRVQALALSPDGSRLYVGGPFTVVGGLTRPGAAALSSAEGSVDARFAPAYVVGANRTGTSTLGFAARVPGHLYVAGGGGENFLDDLDPVTGRRHWRDTADGDVQSVTVVGHAVYAGGHFDSMFRDAAGRSVAPMHLVRVGLVTGRVDQSWLPRLNPMVAPYYYGCWSLVTDGHSLYAGGVFQSVNSVPHPSVAIFPPA